MVIEEKRILQTGLFYQFSDHHFKYSKHGIGARAPLRIIKGRPLKLKEFNDQKYNKDCFKGQIHYLYLISTHIIDPYLVMFFDKRKQKRRVKKEIRN